ncbi:hypothetical protein KP803_15085 [Vibrio sp. ZSDE26]|uniref:Uncharacterized protein n=1 Tax=Vibrio amylolyticus TaxID=2847292 RepID=A0A9X1XMJ2_9VIBR|nr:hypothetical protein [Vibrio amylolyticus]MCK6264603.1 hypothetical protein [Vibrio amylolyticus]
MRSARLVWIFPLIFLLVAGQSIAGKPVKSDGTYLGNGFPSGEHFNLMLHGKKDDHNCETEIEVTSVTDLNLDDEVTPTWAVGDKFLPGECPVEAGVEYTCSYGNVVNMPRGSDSIQILMESGAKGPGKKSGGTDPDLDSTTLQVTDSCTGYTGNDHAIVRIPEDRDGYAVYARVLGKPTDDGGPDFSIEGREIPIMGNDSDSDEVWLLGVIDNEGALIPATCDEGGCELNRWEDTTKGKGVKGATNITGLFSFIGEVCYWDDGDYCLDGAVNVCEGTEFCCSIVDDYDLGDIEYNGTVYDCSKATDDELEALACSVESAEMETLHCRTYTEETWIFNINDFVNVLFDINNDAYNVQIRLYPLPLK